MRGLAALGCAGLGFGAWEAAVGSLPEADPARWDQRGSSVPLEGPRLAGVLRPDPGALDLWVYRGASPRIASFSDGSVSLSARVPDDGQLVLRFGAEADAAGPKRPIAGDPPPSPPPGGSPPGRPPGGPPQEAGVALIVDRSARSAIFGRGLTCTPAPAPPERFTLQVVAKDGALDVSVDGRPVTRCQGRFPPGALVIGSGVRRVQVDDVTVVPAGGAAFADGFGGPARSLLAGVVAAGIGLVAGLRFGARYALALAPLCALPLLGRIDMRAWLDSVRLLHVPDALGPLLVAGLPAAVIAVLLAGARASRASHALLRGAVPLALTLTAAAAADLPRDTPGWALLAALGAPLALLAWVNTHPVRLRVPASWALCAGLALGAEGGVRLTIQDQSWTRTAGWKRASEEFAELLQIRRYRTYPDSGFPVRPPEPDPAHRRIVALGGSSTGGAYQMDDLDQFWPRRLGRTLAGTDWEVVNQGVGGWNTLHVRLYVESQLDRLDGDVYALYVGHNDVLSQAPVPYRDLYARYQAPSSTVYAISGTLHRLRLYVGLKYLLLTMRERGGAVAVPVADARDNLRAVIRAVQAKGARVLLVTEGLNPDPLPMREYGAMQRALAEETGSLYLDAATRLWEAGDPDLFLDDCHLSVDGHVRLATWVREALDEAGWLAVP